MLVKLFEIGPSLPGEMVVESPVTAALVQPVTGPLGIKLSVGETPEVYEVGFMLDEFEG